MSRRPVAVARWAELEDRAPAYAFVANVDLVVVRVDEAVPVLHGRCLHRGAEFAGTGICSGERSMLEEERAESGRYFYELASGRKMTARIAAVRGLELGQATFSSWRFPDWDHVADVRAFADEVRVATGGLPIGFKLSAQHAEYDLDAAHRMLDRCGGLTLQSAGGTKVPA